MGTNNRERRRQKQRAAREEARRRHTGGRSTDRPPVAGDRATRPGEPGGEPRYFRTPGEAVTAAADAYWCREDDVFDELIERVLEHRNPEVRELIEADAPK